MTEFETQVNKDHYSSKYDHLERFVSYHHQVKLIDSLNPRAILEVGIGSGFLSNFLKAKGHAVTTLDFDSSLSPDFVSDIRKIPVPDDSFDVVCAFEVLEHMPYEQSLEAIRELSRVASKYIILSVPRSCVYLNLSLFFGLPIFRSLLPLGFRIPFFWVPASAGNKQHYWELGRRGYSIRRLKRDIGKIGLKVLSSGHIPLNTQHYFFKLEKA